MACSSHQSNLSRLDRVFTLLENSGSAVTRKAAAKQLGDVQQKHPHELNNLLAKLLAYVCHNEWDTRIGAAEAIEAVVAQVPLWKPDAIEKSGEVFSDELCEGKLTFAQFNVDKVLSASQTLLGSSGDEYKLPLEVEGMSATDRVKRQRQMLEKQLGLTVGDKSLGVTSGDLFQDADLDVVVFEKPSNKTIKKEPKQDCVSVISQFSEGMSSRERNLAKRKAKLYLKQQSREVIKQENKNGDGQPSKKRKKKQEIKAEGNIIVPEDIPKHAPSSQEWEEWPFNWICDELMNLLFNSSWESRHGACLALREIIKKHGSGCGKRKNMSALELTLCNQAWLTDLSIRLLCVISLDRFADFVSDQVVAPVRESCAQTLSVVASFLQETHVFEVVDVLLHLHTKQGWEIRQSAMLVLQYIIAVRKDLQSYILPLCFPAIMKGLNDKDGDVRSVSAKSLMPVCTLLSEDPKYNEQVCSLLYILWTSLNQYDEITSSTQSILLLLSKLIKSMPFSKICRSDPPERLLSYLWPFFHHALPSVREAALSTAITMLNGEAEDWNWLTTVSATGLLNLFQCCLLEPKAHVRSLAVETFTLLVQKSSVSSVIECALHVPMWLSLACQPPLVPYEPRQLLSFNQVTNTNKEENGDKERVICGRSTSTHCPEEFEEYLTKTRQLTARLIGMLCRHLFCGVYSDYVTNNSLPSIKQHLLLYMKSQSAVQRTVALHVLSNWWEGSLSLPPFVSAEFLDAVQTVQSETLFYNEVSIKFVQVQSDMKSMLNTLTENQIKPAFCPPKASYSFDDVIYFCTQFFPHVVSLQHKSLCDQKDLLLKLAESGNKMQNIFDCRVKSAAATVIITAVRSTQNKDSLWKLPDKLNPVIRPLMENIKKEDNVTVRLSVSTALAHLVGICADREPNPASKLIKNLSSFLCTSSITCPTAASVAEEFSDETLTSVSLPRERVVFDGILTQLRQIEASRTEITKRKKKQDTSDKQKPSNVAAEGAAKCLQTICSIYGARLFKVLPQLFSVISVLQDSTVRRNVDSMAEEQLHLLLQAVTTLKALLPAITDSELQQTMITLLPSVVSILWTSFSHIRFVCARCIASYAHCLTIQAIPIILEQVLCNLDVTKDIVLRRAAVECIASVIDTMGVAVVTYVVLLVVPLLGCMSDKDPQVRLLSTHCFAQLIQYMPVEAVVPSSCNLRDARIKQTKKFLKTLRSPSWCDCVFTISASGQKALDDYLKLLLSIPDPPDLPQNLVEKKNKERQFLEQLFDPSSLEAYHIAVPINAKLRAYQEDGVKWLAFLNRYKLHGVLCDEMGLGKTLQTICIIASDHHCKSRQYQEENPGGKWSPKSLVVCPPTLTGHWVDEVQRFCGDLAPLQYAGAPAERNKLQEIAHSYNLIIASYDVVRNDIDFFSKFKWNYCVLDEGHAIRNGKSKTSQCIKTLSSNHRLILTGTPIQNSVLELWSLFDFLMPGFLGSEQQFNVSFTKPILASRDAKSSSKEQENGVLAMEALHRQVLPFMLRRMKEDVLKDLPPKIIQDYYCDLSALQLELYEDFARSRAKKDAESSINNIDDDKDQKSRSRGTSHVFQALQYLQKVCNHPSLVLTPTHPQYKSVMHKLKTAHSNLRDIKHASKLMALKQLLLDCGIGVTSDISEQSVVNQHRALIFCQHRNMLDIIQNDLLTAVMPTVTYSRLDGGVPANQRFSIVSRFNNDPSIDLLLLTTKVGGLGLNLTGADTVIFVEHDWNPMVDLQAMDRAHRIGQKKVVNVYRLITRGTLEEKVLGLQKFKLNVANTVVGEDNRRLQSMGTSQVLELFTVDTASKNKAAVEATSSKGLRAMMEDLGELWDQNQYDDEYNLDNFMQSLAD